MSTALQNAIDLSGGQTALAVAINRIIGSNLRQSNIQYWTKSKKGVPAEYCFAIEQATNGQVTREQLHPTFFAPSVSNNTTVTQAKRKAHKKEWLTKKNVVDDSRGAGNV